MTYNKLNALIRKRSLDLQEKRRSILEFPAEQVVEKILDSEKPVELVHSFPEEDLYLLIHPADKLDIAVGQPAGQVAGAVQPVIF